MKFMRKLAASVAAVTVAATSVATFAFSASALTYENDAIVSTDKGPYTAYLCIQAGADKRSVTDDYPNAVEKEKNSKGISCADATFTGNGTYTVSVTVANGSDTIENTIEQLMLETDINSYAFAPKEAETVKGTLPTGCTVSIVINSITVKKTSGSNYPIPYNGASKGALCQGDNGSSIRVNIQQRFFVWQQVRQQVQQQQHRFSDRRLRYRSSCHWQRCSSSSGRWRLYRNQKKEVNGFPSGSNFSTISFFHFYPYIAKSPAFPGGAFRVYAVCCFIGRRCPAA